jgi:hypothetical protein
MAELWDEEVVEVRVASGKVVAVHRIKFATTDEVTMLCRWCGREVARTEHQANPWMHALDAKIICRDENNKPLVPVTVAEPTVWDRGEAEEK